MRLNNVTKHMDGARIRALGTGRKKKLLKEKRPRTTNTSTRVNASGTTTFVVGKAAMQKQEKEFLWNNGLNQKQPAQKCYAETKRHKVFSVISLRFSNGHCALWQSSYSTAILMIGHSGGRTEAGVRVVFDTATAQVDPAHSCVAQVFLARSSCYHLNWWLKLHVCTMYGTVFLGRQNRQRQFCV